MEKVLIQMSKDDYNRFLRMTYTELMQAAIDAKYVNFNLTVEDYKLKGGNDKHLSKVFLESKLEAF